MLKGNTELLVDNGRVLRKAMLHSHISDHDLIEQLRLRGVDNLQEVRAAFKERNGEISVLTERSAPQMLDVSSPRWRSDRDESHWDKSDAIPQPR